MQIKTMLITPALMDFRGIYLPIQSIPQLTSYLIKKGHRVIQKDLNDELYYNLFSGKELQHLFTRIKNILIPLRSKSPEIIMEIENNLHDIIYGDRYLSSLFELQTTKSIFEQLLKKELVIRKLISETMNKLKKRLDSKEAWLPSMWKLGACLLSLAYYPLKYNKNSSLVITPSTLNITEMLEKINDQRINFLEEYYIKYTIPWLKQEQPKLIGISFMVHSQFFGGLTLIKLIRQALPETKIIVGGVLISYLIEDIKKQPALMKFFDFMCVGPGEYTLDGLINHLAGKNNLAEIPNLVYQIDSQIIQNNNKELNINDICLPIPPDEKNKKILALKTNNRCYWHKCSFCIESSMTKSSCTTKPINMILKEIKELVKYYHPELILFIDEAISPKVLKELSNAIIKEKISIKYAIGIRAEKEFTDPELCRDLAASGCVMATLSLESGSPRILKLMNKGINLKNLEIILQNLYKVNIISSLYFVIGFPTETQKDILLTKSFLMKNKKYITGALYPSIFTLWEGMPIIKEPKKYRLKNIKPAPSYQDLKVSYTYETTNGLTLNKSIEEYKNLLKEFNILKSENYSQFSLYHALQKCFK